jgi:hypothetical protein
MRHNRRQRKFALSFAHLMLREWFAANVVLSEEDGIMRTRWQDWCIIAAGAWLIVSPHQLGFTLDHFASSNACGVGGLLVLYNLMIAGRQVDEGQEFVNLLLGMWLIFSPYALGFSWLVSASVDMIAIGAAVVALAGLGIYRSAFAGRRQDIK